MIEFRRDPDTGMLIAYRDGEPVGPVVTMGDIPTNQQPTGGT